MDTFQYENPSPSTGTALQTPNSPLGPTATAAACQTPAEQARATTLAAIDDENLLFRTEIGGRWYAFDPYRLGRILALELKGEAVSKVIKTFQGTPHYDAAGKLVRFEIANHDEAFDAGERLLRAVNAAFGLKAVEWSGEGHSEKLALRVLNEFLRWKAGVKKNTAPSLTSSPSVAATAPPAAGPSPHWSGIASGSCGAGFSPNGPLASPML